MTCPRRVTSCNKCATQVGEDDNGCARASVEQGYLGISSRFFFDPTTALKRSLKKLMKVPFPRKGGIFHSYFAKEWPYWKEPLGQDPQILERCVLPVVQRSVSP